jgi:hypothetical protein
VSADVLLRCPTCRHTWPLARCAWCGELFDAALDYEGREKSAGRPRVYCSIRCARTAYDRRRALRAAHAKEVA